MTDMYEITNGPFAGRKLDITKLVPWRYSSGMPVIINNREMKEWGLDYLTPIFLEVFDPCMGWCITTDVVLMEGIMLPDYQNPMIVDGKTVTNSFGGDVPSQLQALKVTATLRDPEGRVISQSNVLQGINNLNSADLGAKKALLQLYRGLGLPSSPEGFGLPMEEMAPDQTQAPAARPTASSNQAGGIHQIRPISVQRSESEGVEVLEDDNPLGPISSVEPQVQAISNNDGQQVEVVQQPLHNIAATADNSHINPRILTQLEHFAKLAGESVGLLKDDNEAKAELVRLRTESNKRK